MFVSVCVWVCKSGRGMFLMNMFYFHEAGNEIRLFYDEHGALLASCISFFFSFLHISVCFGGYPAWFGLVWFGLVWLAFFFDGMMIHA